MNNKKRYRRFEIGNEPLYKMNFPAFDSINRCCYIKNAKKLLINT